ncbi:hypothetical protein ACOSP6_14765 [Tenacibaculum sp. MEBiC06402]|uniref:hypothetical protein n=1 Tax=unclassified Tenacibaculum TaxID=2635139 RepID=UPI003B9BE68F
MENFKNSKIKSCFVIFGVIVGIVGILHGCAELLKGSELIKYNSVEALPYNWPNFEFYNLMKGAPVYSILTDIPHYVLGLLAIFISTVMIVFSARFFTLNFKGLLLFSVFSSGIFLFGAGEGTPIAISLPLIIFGVYLLLFPEKKVRSIYSRRILLNCFNIFFVIQIFSWLLFFPGLFLLSFYHEIPQWLFLFDFISMPISILGAGFFGLQLDKTSSAIITSLDKL